MRWSLFLLGVAADLVVASPCKPSISTSEAATVTPVSTTEATSTILATSSIALFETTATIELTTTTTTSEDITTTTAAVEDTTTITETSAGTTSEAATTSQPPATETTYILSASGDSLNGVQAHGSGQPGTVIAFDAFFSGITPRKFTLDSAGRLQDAETEAYVCAIYYFSPSDESPPPVSFCLRGLVDARQGQEYLTCEINNENLACTAPRVFCRSEGNNLICSSAGGDANDTFFIDSGKLWYIGRGDPPNQFPISVSARKQR